MSSSYRKSRYRMTPEFTRPDGRRPEFYGLRSRSITQAAGVLEHVVKEHDRLDRLALYYYNDSRLWWRIVDANPDIMYSGDLLIREKIGAIILIPGSTDIQGGL